MPSSRRQIRRIESFTRNDTPPACHNLQQQQHPFVWIQAYYILTSFPAIKSNRKISIKIFFVEPIAVVLLLLPCSEHMHMLFVVCIFHAKHIIVFVVARRGLFRCTLNREISKCLRMNPLRLLFVSCGQNDGGHGQQNGNKESLWLYAFGTQNLFSASVALNWECFDRWNFTIYEQKIFSQ